VQVCLRPRWFASKVPKSIFESKVVEILGPYCKLRIVEGFLGKLHNFLINAIISNSIQFSNYQAYKMKQERHPNESLKVVLPMNLLETDKTLGKRRAPDQDEPQPAKR